MQPDENGRVDRAEDESGGAEDTVVVYPEGRGDEYTEGPANGACKHCGNKRLDGQNSHGDVICPDCGWYTSEWRYDG